MTEAEARRRYAAAVDDAVARFPDVGRAFVEGGWTLAFSNARRQIGLCDAARRRILLSRFHLETMPADGIEDTIRHELAHAFDFLTRGRSDHGPAWKAWARALGAVPRARSKWTPAGFRWARQCPACSRIVGTYYRRPTSRRRYACGPCLHERGIRRFDARFELRVVELKNVPDWQERLPAKLRGR